MIDRTQLTEALADFDNPPNWTETWEDDHRMGRSLRVIAEAARLLLDFPTDEMVRPIRQSVFDAVMNHLGMDESDMDDQADASELTDSIMTAWLEAVRRVMFGEQDAQVTTG